MKNTLLVLVLLLCANIYAQSQWEFSVYGGGGKSTLLYDFPDKNGKGFGGLGGLGYTFFFNEYFGLGLGAELAVYNTEEKPDADYKQERFFMPLQVPLMLQFQAGDWHKFFFALGGKWGVRFIGEGPDDIDLNKKGALKKGYAMASAETGMKWQIREGVYLYTGAYLDYGFTPMLKSEYRESKDMSPVALGFKLRLGLGGGSIIDPPSLVFSAGPDSISMGQSTVLNWIVTEAEEVSIAGVGKVQSNGSLKVNPSETSVYVITAKGRGGVKVDSVTVAVKSAPIPSVVFNASPATIQTGQATALNWMVSDADEITLEGVGPVPDKGTREIKPVATTKYFLTAKSKGGVKRDSLEVIVEIPPGPSVIFNATPEVIQKGQSTKLNWITDAKEVSIEGIGTVPDKGSKEVKPVQTTKYTITAKGGKGNVTTQVIEVVVEEPPPIEEKVNLKGVNFLSGKAVLSLDAKKVLDGVAEQLLAYPNVKIEIQGHTDNVGKEATNRRISEDRARAVVAYLATKGVKMNRMKAVGYGSNLPVADNSTAEGRELNRRIEMVRMD